MLGTREDLKWTLKGQRNYKSNVTGIWRKRECPSGWGFVGKGRSCFVGEKRWAGSLAF